MITRPLDLASKLRPEPRNLDFLFFVNGGLIVLFFFLFGSRFVLAPGLALKVQEIPGARAGAVPTSARITVKQSGLIFTDNGPVDLPRLRDWLTEQARKVKQPSLLIIASSEVPQGKIMQIASVAYAVGFAKVQEAAEEPVADLH